MRVSCVRCSLQISPPQSATVKTGQTDLSVTPLERKMRHLSVSGGFGSESEHGAGRSRHHDHDSDSDAVWEGERRF